jgi:cytochrome c-type biogenesis protein CcmH
MASMGRLLRLHLVVLATLAAFAFPARAVEPGEMLQDPALERRARQISAELRCLVCQNQSIDDSNAPLARDLRILVRERLSQGDSDAAVLRFVVDRYGTFVLLRPPLSAAILLLWLTPLALLVIGGVIAFRTTRRRSAAAAPSAELTPAEQQRLAEILERKP